MGIARVKEGWMELTPIQTKVGNGKRFEIYHYTRNNIEKIQKENGVESITFIPVGSKSFMNETIIEYNIMVVYGAKEEGG